MTVSNYISGEELPEVIQYTPKFGNLSIPATTNIMEEGTEETTERIRITTEELINMEEFIGNRDSESRIENKARKKALCGDDWNVSHTIHFEVGELSEFDTWEYMINGKKVMVSFQAGTKFLLNGNTRAWGIRKGYFKNVPSHVEANLIKFKTLDDMQQFYWKIDSQISTETATDVFHSIYDKLEFEPVSKKYGTGGSYGTGLSVMGAIICPTKWGERGFAYQNSYRPLPHEDQTRAQNRMRQEMFTYYVDEMRFNDSLCAVQEKNKKHTRFDAAAQAAHMIKFRGDGGVITRMHQKFIDAYFDPTQRNISLVNNPLQYALAEAWGPINFREHDKMIENMQRGNFGLNKDDVRGGGYFAVAKHLFYLVQIEKDGQIDRKQPMKKSVHRGGSFDYIAWMMDYVREHRLFFFVNDPAYVGANLK